MITKLITKDLHYNQLITQNTELITKNTSSSRSSSSGSDSTQ